VWWGWVGPVRGVRACVHGCSGEHQTNDLLGGCASGWLVAGNSKRIGVRHHALATVNTQKHDDLWVVCDVAVMCGCGGWVGGSEVDRSI
jgi:hypothetical protein